MQKQSYDRGKTEVILLFTSILTNNIKETLTDIVKNESTKPDVLRDTSSRQNEICWRRNRDMKQAQSRLTVGAIEINGSLTTIFLTFGNIIQTSGAMEEERNWHPLSPNPKEAGRE